MNKRIFILTVAIFIFVFSTFPISISAIANPAAVYCTELGYELEIRTKPDGGQYGVCIFPDGSECNQWQYYCKCEPEGIGCWQDDFDCDFPCKGLSCKKAGESALVSECCKGLEKIAPTKIYDDECQKTDMTGWAFICSDCGNGLCEKWESECNCPKDCSRTAGGTGEGIPVAGGVGEGIPRAGGVGEGIPGTGGIGEGIPVNIERMGGGGLKEVIIEESAPGQLSIKTEEAAAITSETLSIKDNKLSIETTEGKKQVKVLPDMASVKAMAAGIQEVKQIELKQEMAKPVYSVKGTKRARLFFIFPVTLNMETKVNAESGEIISVRKPWWSFLAW